MRQVTKMIPGIEDGQKITTGGHVPELTRACSGQRGPTSRNNESVNHFRAPLNLHKDSAGRLETMEYLDTDWRAVKSIYHHASNHQHGSHCARSD